MSNTQTKIVTGHWQDAPAREYTVRISLGTWNGRDDLADLGIFFYTDGEPVNVGDTIAEDFIITSIQGE